MDEELKKNSFTNFLYTIKNEHVLLFICYLVIASSSFNYDLLRFLPSIPFMVLSYYIARNLSYKWSIPTLIYIVSAIFFNITLTKNNFVFPILKEGTVTIQEDGFCVVYKNGLRGYIGKNQKAINDNPVSFIAVTKGQVFPVIGVSIIPKITDSSVLLETEVGSFDARYQGSGYSINKKVSISPYWSVLMRPAIIIAGAVLSPFILAIIMSYSVFD